MILLLDTNVVIWWLTDSDKLGPRTVNDLSNPLNRVYSSDLVLLESAIKLRTGKLGKAINFRTVEQELQADGIEQTTFDGWAAEQFMNVPELHWSDPFDMAHISLALAKHMVLVTADHQILKAQVPGLRVQDAKL